MSLACPSCCADLYVTSATAVQLLRVEKVGEQYHSSYLDALTKFVSLGSQKLNK